MKKLIFCLVLFNAVNLTASAFRNESVPVKSNIEISVEEIRIIGTSACNCMNKLDAKNLTTSELKRKALNNCLMNAIQDNEAIISVNKDTSTTASLELNRKIGEYLKNNCPTFSTLFLNK